LDRLFPTQPVIKMLCCYLNIFVFVYVIDLKEYSFHFYGLY